MLNLKHRFLSSVHPFCFLLALLAMTACSNSEQVAEPTAQESTKPIRLKLAHGWPKSYPVFGESVDRFAEMVEEMSDGRIQITVHSTNKHKSAFGIFDFVKSGQYDIGQSASYYYGGKDPDTLFFSSMPLGMTEEEQRAWFYHGGGLELANEVYAKHNIEVALAGNSGIQMGGWFRKEINTVDDLKGLKMRIPGFAGKVVAGVGVVPTNIPTGELYQALERGTLDALEWVGPGLDLRMGFHKIAPYYYAGWHEPGTELIYFFNTKTMEKLPQWARTLLKNAARLAGNDMSTHMFAVNAENLDTLAKQFPDVKFRVFPPEVMAALKESNRLLMEQEIARSPMAKKIIESRREFLRKARAWSTTGTQAYLETVAE